MQPDESAEVGKIQVNWEKTGLKGVVGDALVVGQKYSSWSSAAGIGIMELLQVHGNAYRGRGQAPTYVVRSIAKTKGGIDRKVVSLSMWATIEASLLVILRHRKHDKNCLRHSEACNFLKTDAYEF